MVSETETIIKLIYLFVFGSEIYPIHNFYGSSGDPYVETANPAVRVVVPIQRRPRKEERKILVQRSERENRWRRCYAVGDVIRQARACPAAILVLIVRDKGGRGVGITATRPSYTLPVERENRLATVIYQVREPCITNNRYSC